MGLRRAGIWAFTASSYVTGVMIAYLAAALLLGVLPLNKGYQPVADGVDVYLRTNGAHADLIVPIHTPEVDWTTRLPIASLRPIEGVTDDLSFGWGDRGFYIETPTWSDIRLPTAVAAVLGLGPSVLHVEAVPTPPDGVGTRHLRLSDQQYSRLVAYIESGFHRGRDGAPIPIPGAHYGFHDAFFEAEGRYSPFLTCNEWARRGLASAGVRVPLWSPFDKALLYQLEQSGALQD